jgi:hypothetical protein
MNVHPSDAADSPHQYGSRKLMPCSGRQLRALPLQSGRNQLARPTFQRRLAMRTVDSSPTPDVKRRTLPASHEPPPAPSNGYRRNPNMTSAAADMRVITCIDGDGGERISVFGMDRAEICGVFKPAGHPYWLIHRPPLHTIGDGVSAPGQRLRVSPDGKPPKHTRAQAICDHGRRGFSWTQPGAGIPRESRPPGRSRIITASDGVPLSVRDYGSSRAPDHTVVLLHGFCLDQSSWDIQIGLLGSASSRPVPGAQIIGRSV